jgi:hypothetical protein
MPESLRTRWPWSHYRPRNPQASSAVPCIRLCFPTHSGGLGLPYSSKLAQRQCGVSMVNVPHTGSLSSRAQWGSGHGIQQPYREWYFAVRLHLKSSKCVQISTVFKKFAHTISFTFFLSIIYLSIYLSIYLFIYHLSIYSSFHLSIFLSIYLSMNPFVCVCTLLWIIKFMRKFYHSKWRNTIYLKYLYVPLRLNLNYT